MTDSIPRSINDVMTACRGSTNQCQAQIVNYACALCQGGSSSVAPVGRGISSVNVRIPNSKPVMSHRQWNPELIPSGMGCGDSKDDCFVSRWDPELLRAGASLYLDPDLL